MDNIVFDKQYLYIYLHLSIFDGNINFDEYYVEDCANASRNSIVGKSPVAVGSYGSFNGIEFHSGENH